jgi:hypothetical protein
VARKGRRSGGQDFSGEGIGSINAEEERERKKKN